MRGAASSDSEALGHGWSLFLLVLVGTAVLLTPLTVARWRLEPFVLPKLVVLWGLLAVCAVSVALGGLLTRRGGLELRIHTVPDVALGLFVALSAAATLASTDPWQSLVGERGQYQGLLTTSLYVGMFLAARVAVTSPRRLTALFAAVTIGSTLVAAYAIAQQASIDPVWGTRIDYERAFASIGQPNALASYLVIGIPVSLALARHARGVWSWVAVAAAATQSIGVIATESRGGYLALIGVWVATAAAALRRGAGNTKLRRALPLTVAAVVAVVIVATPVRTSAVDAWDRLATIEELTDDDSIRTHLELWRVGANTALGDPLLGTGPETFPDVFPSESREVLSSERSAHYDAYRVESPHNLFISIAAGSGAFALVAFCAFLVGVWRTTARTARASEGSADALHAVLLAGAAFVLTNLFITTDLTSTVVMWILAGAGLGLGATRAPSPGVGSHPSP